MTTRGTKVRRLLMRDVWPHTHGKVEHSHAWSTTEHNHLARAVCNRTECQGDEAHNVHPAPPSLEEPVSRAS